MQTTYVNNVNVGDELFVPCRGRGGHGAHVIVTKVNNKSFKATERDMSYRPGILWTVSKGACFAIFKKDGSRDKVWVNDD
jgi:hypothetical protein